MTTKETATTASGLVLNKHRLGQVLAACIAAAGLALVISLLNQRWINAGFLLTASSTLLWAWWMARRGSTDVAAWLLLTTLTLTVCGLMVLSEGLHDEAVGALPGILIFASMFGTRRLFLALLLLMMTALSGIALANINGWLVSNIHPVNWGTLINMLAILSATAFFVWLLATDLKSALARAAIENQRLAESNARIEVLANHDALTNLPNRLLARDRLEQALTGARRNGTSAAVLFLDLDNFKTINDSLGHNTGDMLLCQVADRLTQVVRDFDTVSRQGGDEFLIILSQIADADGATTVAAKIIEQLAMPCAINGHEVFATSSLGIAMYPKDGQDADTLLKHADLAMYRAKESGRNAFAFFDADMNSSVIEHLHLANGVRAALANNDFRLYYQPQFDLVSGCIVGAEALIRWEHQTLGFISPAKFIPVAERSGLICTLGAWVLDEACRQARFWQDAGMSTLVVAVNVSPVQFRRNTIESEVENALLKHKLKPAGIELEITESLLVADSSHLSEVLDRLHAMGIQLAIDDFGTGYSNLGYLKRFKLERLKIDQSFVRQLLKSPHDAGIVRAIIEMAHCLDIKVVAEGVEDAATLQRLREMGCDYGQGYHWSPALPPDEFWHFLTTNQTGIQPNIAIEYGANIT